MGSEVHMVEIGRKPISLRIVKAEGFIKLKPQTIKMIKKGEIAKGNVIAVSKAAAILAAKKTWELIPLCHPIPLTGINVEIHLMEDKIKTVVEVRAIARTGAEMEALTAVCISLLTIWDMVKEYEKDKEGLYPNVSIEGVKVVTKLKTDISETINPASLPPP